MSCIDLFCVIYVVIYRCAFAHLPMLIRSAFRFASLGSFRMAFLFISFVLFHLSLVREVFEVLKGAWMLASRGNSDATDH
jgi:hypothetical protein